VQAGQRAGVDLVGLHMGMGDRLHLKRVGDHYSLHKGRQNARHCHAVAGRFDHHLVRRQKALAEAFQCCSGHVDPATMSKVALFPENHLSESSVDVHSNDASHLHHLLSHIE
jgi:hypothetical protein